MNTIMFSLLVFLLFLTHSSSQTVTTRFNNQKLTEFPDPSDIPSDTTHLYLEYNQIRYIPEGSLCHITNLRMLRLHVNELSRVGNLSCVGHSLTHLYLNKNPLKELPASSFEGLNVLQILNLERAELVQFPDLWDVADTLKTLILYVNRDMGGLPSDDKLAQFTTLSVLNIIAIGLESFPNLTMFNNTLTTLEMGHEQVLRYVDINEVNGLTKLTRLRLLNIGLTDFPHITIPGLLFLQISHVDLSSSAQESFTGPPTIKTLYLSVCSLSAVPDLSAFPEIQELGLDSNELQEIKRHELCMLPKLLTLKLYRTNLQNIPCSCSLLSSVVIYANQLTEFPNIAFCTKRCLHPRQFHHAHTRNTCCYDEEARHIISASQPCRETGRHFGPGKQSISHTGLEGNSDTGPVQVRACVAEDSPGDGGEHCA